MDSVRYKVNNIRTKIKITVRRIKETAAVFRGGSIFKTGSTR